MDSRRTPPPVGRVDKAATELLLDFLKRPENSHDWRIRLLRRHGRMFPAAPLPEDVPVMKLGSCYLNAYTLAKAQPGRFTYYEGEAATVRAEGWSQAHAWCVDPDGRVVDPTWAALRADGPAAYLGVPIPLAVAADYAYEGSRGTFEGWLLDRRDEMETDLPRLLGLDPV